MKNGLDKVAHAVEQKAAEKGLTIFPSIPDLQYIPVASWDEESEEWEAFLDLAVKVKATTLYVGKVFFDLERSISKAVREASSSRRKSTNSIAPVGMLGRMPSRRIQSVPGSPPPFNESSELFASIVEKTKQYKKHSGKMMEFECVWVQNGVAHQMMLYAEEIEDCIADVEQIVVERISEEVNADQQAAGDVENTSEEKEGDATELEYRRLHDLAERMARHERFIEAKSEAKRDYMASQLYPEESAANHFQIAELASVVYWWHLEPEERTVKTQKAKELFQQGVPPKYIAGMLHMPEAQVLASIGVQKIGQRKGDQAKLELELE